MKAVFCKNGRRKTITIKVNVNLREAKKYLEHLDEQACVQEQVVAELLVYGRSSREYIFDKVTHRHVYLPA